MWLAKYFAFLVFPNIFLHFCCYCWTKCLKHNIAFIRQWCHLIITVEWPFWHWRTEKIGSHCVIIMEWKQTFFLQYFNVIFVLENYVVILLELNSEVKEGRRKKILMKTYSLSLPPTKQTILEKNTSTCKKCLRGRLGLWLELVLQHFILQSFQSSLGPRSAVDNNLKVPRTFFLHFLLGHETNHCLPLSLTDSLLFREVCQ